MYDVVVIGAGPAGISASIQLKRSGIEPLLLEKDETGGLLLNANLVENYPGFPEGINGFALVEKFKKQAKTFGLDFATGTVEKINTVKQNDISFWQIKTEDKTFNSLSIIVATGAVIQNSMFRVKKSLQEKGYPTVQPVMALYSGIKILSWSVEEMRR